MLEHDLVMAQYRRLRPAGVTGCDRVVDRLMNIQQNGSTGAGQPPRLGLRPDPKLMFLAQHGRVHALVQGGQVGVARSPDDGPWSRSSMRLTDAATMCCGLRST